MRAHVVDKVIKITTAVIVRERAIERAAIRKGPPALEVDGDGEGPSPGSKRVAQQHLRSSPSKYAKAADEDEAHLYGEISEDEEGGEDEEDEVAAKDAAKELVTGFVDWCKTAYIKTKKGRDELLTTYPREKVHVWWWNVGLKVLQKKWARLRWVARALLSITAGSGNLERYFCNIPAVVTSKRSSLTPARVEMLIICHILQQMGQRLAPDQIKSLSRKQVEAALPGRMKLVGLMSKLKEMFEGLSFQSEEEQDLWVPDDAGAMAPWSSVGELLTEWDRMDEVLVELQEGEVAGMLYDAMMDSAGQDGMGN